MCKERHKARHETRDRSAGGVGLGILETKSKHFKPTIDGIARLSQEPQSQEFSSSPDISKPALRPRNDGISAVFPATQPAESWNNVQDMHISDLSANYFNPPVDFTDTPRPTSEYQFMDQSPGIYEIGNMYHDMSFDLVHFNVTGFAPPQPDCRHTAPQTIPESPIGSSNEAQCTSFETTSGDGSNLQNEENAIYPTPTETVQRRTSCKPVDSNESLDQVMGNMDEPSVENQTAVRRSSSDSSAMALLALSRAQETSVVSVPQIVETPSTWRRPSLSITSEKREELLEFITEIRPVRPDGTLLDGDSPDFLLVSNCRASTVLWVFD